MKPDISREPVSPLTENKHVASRLLQTRLRSGNLVTVHGKEHLEYTLSLQVVLGHFRVDRKHGLNFISALKSRMTNNQCLSLAILHYISSKWVSLLNSRYLPSISL